MKNRKEITDKMLLLLYLSLSSFARLRSLTYSAIANDNTGFKGHHINIFLLCYILRWTPSSFPDEYRARRENNDLIKLFLKTLYSMGGDSNRLRFSGTKSERK